MEKIKNGSRSPGKHDTDSSQLKRQVVAVASRSQEKAKSFCREIRIETYGSYDRCLEDPQLVYIATPHSHLF